MVKTASVQTATQSQHTAVNGGILIRVIEKADEPTVLELKVLTRTPLS